MKKVIGIFLSAALFVSLSAPAFGVTDTEADSWTAPDSGFEIQVPDSYQNAKGYVYFTDLGEGVYPGSGVVQAVSAYVSMPPDEYKALMEEQMEAYENDDLEKLNEMVEKTSGIEWSLFTVYGINRNRGEDEIRNIVTGRLDLNPESYGGDEELVAAIGALYENMQYREIGEKDGLRYYISYFNPDDCMKYLELLGVTEPDPVYLDEYKALLEQNESLLDNVTLTGGAILADTAELGSKLVFETTDLEGNSITSDEIFAGHRVTMINMWSTWCDPCKNELPELAKMAEDFEKQDCQIIGICLDAEDEETMAEARAILADAGADYLNIVPFEGREQLLPNQLYPTTYFVDEDGIVLDEVINGALLTQYPQALKKLLATLAM